MKFYVVMFLILFIVVFIVPLGFRQGTTSRHGVDPADIEIPERLTLKGWLRNVKEFWLVVRPVQTFNEWRYGSLSLADMLFDLLLTIVCGACIGALPAFFIWFLVFH